MKRRSFLEAVGAAVAAIPFVRGTVANPPEPPKQKPEQKPDDSNRYQEYGGSCCTAASSSFYPAEHYKFRVAPHPGQNPFRTSLADFLDDNPNLRP